MATRNQKTGQKAAQRNDAPGMKRGSLYASEEAFAQFDAAVTRILKALGSGTPRHVAVTALLEAGAQQAGPVTQQLVDRQTAELEQQLAKLRDQNAED